MYMPSLITLHYKNPCDFYSVCYSGFCAGLPHILEYSAGKSLIISGFSDTSDNSSGIFLAAVSLKGFGSAQSWQMLAPSEASAHLESMITARSYCQEVMTKTGFPPFSG